MKTDKKIEIKQEFEDRVDEVLNDMEFDNKGETKVHEFGYKYQSEDYMVNHEVHTVTDFGNIWNFIEKTLNTEVQKAVEEAVRGFAYYLLKRRNKDEFWGLSEGEVEMAMIVAKQYLESEEK
jgi:S-adenosylmethionine hydrolase